MAAVGAQFDPQDVDSLEVNRGGLSTSVGDRPYGVFNVVPRSGFEGDRFGDLTASYGSYNLANVHLAMGDHTDNQKAAYFASVSANRTDFGLERVDIPVLHDDQHSFSGFASLLYNRSIRDQFRVVGSLRSQNDQVPNVVEQEALGIDDRETARDLFTNFTWLHTTEKGNVLTVSPYYHFNRQKYIGGPNDPLVTFDNHASNYLGGFASYGMTREHGTIRFGTDSFVEHDDSLFSLTETTGALRSATESQKLWSNVTALFAEGSLRASSWLTVNGGARYQRFSGTVTEDAVSPRVGAAVSVGKIGVLRASYSQYYEHPPTSTISGPLLNFALSEGFGFLPVLGEHDHILELGFGIPVHGWTLDFDTYRNMVDNLQDHDVLGNSNLLLPVTIEHGRVRAFESTLRSPLIKRRLQVHYAFAYQVAEGRGAVTGGMTDFRPPSGSDYFYLDHDQRVTFNSGATLNLPRGFWASGTVLVGSGFLLGEGPDHLPAHTTGDIAVGKRFNETLQLRFTATNVTNKTYLTGFENAFAGTHYAAPRQLSVQVQYKFHY
jgi:outer membrane receptor protein involved in Fe transport